MLFGNSNIVCGGYLTKINYLHPLKIGLFVMFKLLIPSKMREINEIWRDISGYEGIYQVSSLGRIKSMDRVDCDNRHRKERILKPRKNSKGYLMVCLCKDGKKKMYKVHKLVSNTFLPNPNKLETINHINEIKTDNRVDNLEWMTNKDNVRYSQAVSVNQFTFDGRFIRTWDCIMEVEYQLGFNHTNICQCCKGKLKSAYGYQWFYSNDPLQPEPPLFLNF